MANEVKITVTADDNASAKIEGITSSVGKMRDLVAATAAGFAAFKAADAIFQTVKDSINSALKAAEDYNVVQAQTDAVLRSTGGAAGLAKSEIANLAASLEQMSGIDEVAIQSAENLLLTFTNIGGDVFPQATEAILDMSVALGQDLKSSAIQIGKALQDPIEGVTALRRVGVNFNETQRDTIEAMVKAGDTAKAQAYILRELQTEFGGSAKAAEDARGGINRAKDAFDDAQRDVAQLFIPVLHAAQTAAFEFTVELLTKLRPALETIAAAAKAMAGDWEGAWRGLYESMRTEDTVRNIVTLINWVEALGNSLKFFANAGIGAANAAIAVGKALYISGLAAAGNFEEVNKQIELMKSGEAFFKTFDYTKHTTVGDFMSRAGAGSLTSGVIATVVDDVNNFFESAKSGSTDLVATASKAKGKIADDTNAMNQALKAINDQFLVDQVQAYLNGGEKAVAEVKASQDKILAEALSVAGKIAQLYSVDVASIIDDVMKGLTDRAKKLKEAADASNKAIFDLTTQLWRNAGGPNMSVQSAQGLAAIAQAATLGLTGYTTAEGKFIATGSTPGADITEALNRGLLKDTFGTTTIVNVNGVITDPAATGRAVADAINAASAQGGAIISAGAVQ